MTPIGNAADFCNERKAALYTRVPMEAPERSLRRVEELLADAQPPRERHTPARVAERTLTLAVLRGALLDLLATDDTARTTAAVDRHLAGLRTAARTPPSKR